MATEREAFRQLIDARVATVGSLPKRAGLQDVLDTLELIRDYEKAFPGSMTQAHSDIPALSSTILRDFEDLTTALRGPNSMDLFRWSSGEQAKILESLRAFAGEKGVVPNIRDSLMREADGLESTLSNLDTRIESERWREELQDAVGEANQYVEVARNAAEIAQESAGTTGNASLSQYFDEYAAAELSAARGFRTATLWAIGAAVLVAVALWLPVWGKQEWPEVVYHLAVVAGIGALGAYLGRQSGQHRRVYNWAKGIAVQLRSFPAFVQPVINADTVAQIYLLFANRVMGAMPERLGKGTNTDPVGVAQVVELVSALTKQST